MQNKAEHMSLWRKDILRYQIRDCLPLLAGYSRSGPRLRLPARPVVPLAVVAGCGSVACSRVVTDGARWGSLSLLPRTISAGLARVTPNPRRPPLILVRQGVYALCRHPMFFGYDLAGLGAVLLSRFPASLLISLPIFYIWQILFLRKEERYLTRRFKGEFV